MIKNKKKHMMELSFVVQIGAKFSFKSLNGFEKVSTQEATTLSRSNNTSKKVNVPTQIKQNSLLLWDKCQDLSNLEVRPSITQTHITNITTLQVHTKISLWSTVTTNLPLKVNFSLRPYFTLRLVSRSWKQSLTIRIWKHITIQYTNILTYKTNY